jgi:hypothetical protein
LQLGQLAAAQGGGEGAEACLVVGVYVCVFKYVFWLVGWLVGWLDWPVLFTRFYFFLNKCCGFDTLIHYSHVFVMRVPGRSIG